MLINHSGALASFCARLAQATREQGLPVAIDTEFISERRYTPQLCLVQLHCAAEGGALDALVDPLAVDLAPLLPLLADENVVKIVHAGGQDLQIIFQQFNCGARNVFDTQIAAAFLGYGHQVGYVELVRRLLNLHISKEQQFTDWAKRPLSPAQMDYALADVLHLPPLYAALRDELVTRGRLDWAQTEFRRAETRAREPLAPHEVYRKLGSAGLTRRQLGALRELAATRETLARGLDKPPSFIMPDTSIVQVAKHPPPDAGALRAQRGMPGLSVPHANEFMAALARAAQLAPADLPPTSGNGRSNPHTDIVVSLLNLVAQLRAGQHDISRTYLAPRDQIITLAQWWLANDGSEPPALPILADWRRELLGHELLQFLSGHVGLALDTTEPDRSGERPVVRVVPAKVA